MKLQGYMRRNQVRLVLNALVPSFFMVEIHCFGRKKPQQNVWFIFHIVGKSEGETSMEVVVIVKLLNEITSYRVGNNLSYPFHLLPWILILILILVKISFSCPTQLALVSLPGSHSLCLSCLVKIFKIAIGMNKWSMCILQLQN